MTPTLRRKLEALAERREELERLLADPGVIGDSERFRNFSREFTRNWPNSRTKRSTPPGSVWRSSTTN